MLDLGTVRPGSTIRIPFSTFDKDDGSSVTATNFAAADILIYKDGSTTERASTSGFTATTDFDTKTGKHLITIDLADNTTANFYAAGSEYLVAVDSVTVDAVTVGGWVARFRIGYPGAVLDTTIATLASQTSFTLTTGPAEDDALNGHWVIIHDIASAVQLGKAIVLDYTGSTKTVTLVAGTTFTAAAGDNISVMDLAPLQPTTTGRTLDVTATGAAGIDWANVENQSTSVNLSSTTTNLVNTATTVTNQLTAAQIATGVWQDATAGDFTVASSIGKALYINNVAPGGSGGLLISGSNSGTTTFGALTVTGATTFTGAITGSNASNNLRINGVAPGASGGLLISGSNSGTTTLAALTVTGATTLTGNVSMAAGLNITQSTLNGSALVVTGNGTGHGIIATSGSGATGDGIRGVAASTNGNGFSLAGSGTGDGLSATGGATGHGIECIGGGTSGNGMRVSGTAGNSIGFNILGQGSAAGMSCTGGATGAGAAFIGGATSGNSINQSVTSGNAYIAANITHFGGTAGTFASGRPEVNTSHIAGSAVSTSTAQIGVNVVNAGGTAWASGSLTSGVFAAGAINAAAIATGAIDADALATDAVAEIADGVWDEAISGHLTAGSTGAALNGATAPTAAAVADAVWDEAIAGHLSAGSTGEALNAAGAAGDPWTTTLPGAYGAGSAGYIVGNNLNATVSSRSSHSAADVWAVATRVLTAATNITSTGGSVPITAGGLVSSDVTAISTDTTAANNCESFFDGTGYAGTNNVIPTVTNVTTVNGLAAGVITTASIANSALTTGKFDSTTYDDIASAVWEDSVASHTTPGTFGGNFSTITSIDGKVDTIDTVVDAIKVKTDYLPSATAGAAGGVFIAGSNAATTVNFTGNLTGNVTGTIGGLSAAALADFFDTNSGTTYASAVAGSVVKEIADNAGGSGLTAGAIADAVWDEAISGHLTSGSTGAKLNSAASAGDPWTTSLPGTYTGTEAGAILGTLRSSTMTVSHPVPSEDNTIELVIGDDYYAADSRNLSFSYGATPSLSGATVKFKIQLEETDTGYSSTNTSTTTTGSVSGTNPQVVTFDIPGTTTDDLSEGWHDYEVEATLSNGHVVTLTRGRVEMLSQVV